MTTLATAIERRQWELTALYLMLGVTRAAASLPPEAVDGLIELLSGLDEDERPPQGAGRGRRRR
jgi:hypothetical protein